MKQQEILEVIEKRCVEILHRTELSIAEWIEFAKMIAEHFDSYSVQRIADAKLYFDCKRGCALCCNHWVEDLYAFESLRLLARLKNYSPQLLAAISKEARIAELGMESIYDDFPELEELELLHHFYKLEIPCPLRSEEGECLVYNERPLTCRAFYSRSRDRFCMPNDNETERDGTFLVQFPEYIESLLDDVHRKAAKQFPYPTSLRSMLVIAGKEKSV